MVRFKYGFNSGGKEGEDILNGKIKAKKYSNMYGLIEDLGKYEAEFL